MIERLTESKMTNRRLERMVALVTGAGGGENGGIGAGIARCLAREGARVAVNDLTVGSASATVAQLQAMGVEALAVLGNVADAAQAETLIADTVEHFGQLDILVNNAGIGGGATAVERMTDEDWLRVVAVNLNGPFYTSRAAVRVMRPRRFGRIVNIASVAAIRVSFLGGAAYTASKAGLLGLTRHLAAEVAQYGITVNAVMPGATATPLFRSRANDDAITKIAGAIPAQRLARPEDMGAVVAFLASREAGYLTGAEIPVDGAVTVLPGDFTAYRASSGKDTG